MRGSSFRTAVALAVFAATFLTAAAAAPVASSANADHQQVVDFWTNERVAQAVPRDFVRTPNGDFQPSMGKPPGTPGGGGNDGGSGGVTGASWTGGGLVADTTGKVLFAMGGSYFVCSASVVEDTANGRSIVLTAAHCVFDEAAGQFASNWMFIPNYDAAPAGLDTAGAFCSSTQYGCWSASALVAHSGYTTAGGFNNQAVQHDFAFAVLGAGGHSGGALVEDVVGAQAIAFDANAGGVVVDAFGYPAAQKYKGTDLVYCEGGTGFDANTGDTTYKLACDMTGGSSGGPWMRDFNATTGTGTLTSLNSYGYSGDKSMHGPKFNADTQALYNTATTTNGNVVVP